MEVEGHFEKLDLICFLFRKTNQARIHQAPPSLRNSKVTTLTTTLIDRTRRKRSIVKMMNLTSPVTTVEFPIQNPILNPISPPQMKTRTKIASRR